MKKFLQMLKMKIEDETAAFAILGAMIITFAITIGTFEYISHTQLAEVGSNVNMAQSESENVASNIEETNTNELETESTIDEEKAKKENEEEYEKLKKEKKISSAADKYYIKVNYGAQVVTIYTKDSNGNYTKPIKAMVCSTGTYTPTSGTYRTLGKGNWWPLMGDVYGQYSTWICGDILFHSVPYLEKGDKSSLEYWAYDQLGQRVSMGCVRLTVKDAKWIYENCPIGTQVEFYSSSNPGPLGKPTARKISSAPSDVRGWDPTDPDSRNPWPEYLKELENKKEEENNKPNKPENTTNEVDNNTIVNDITNDIANETVNDIVNDDVNDTTNEVIDNSENTNAITPGDNEEAINDVLTNTEASTN